MNSFKQLPLSELRTGLPKFKRQVQLGMKRIAALYYGKVVGFLVPLSDLERAQKEGLIQKTTELSLSEFRAQLTECWEELQVDLDCVYVTYHTRRAMAFVSPRLSASLDIPVSEVAHLLLAVDSGLINVESVLGEEKVNV